MISPETLTPIYQSLMSLRSTSPKITTAIEVGIQEGVYGFFLRDCFKSISTLDGIETNPRNKSAMWVVYSRILQMYPIDYLSAVDHSYDLILSVNTINSMSTHEGLMLLDLFKKRGKNIIVSFCNSGLYKSKWSDEVFSDFGFKKFSGDDCWGVHIMV